MNWFNYFRLVGGAKKRTLLQRATARLQLEWLEAREVPAVPSVLSVAPGTGGLLGGAITVQFSEDVTGADQATTYRLFASDGTPVTINPAGITYNNTTFTTTISSSALSVSGGVLTAGAYSLFLRGDQVVSVSTNDPLARPGELVVANLNRNSLSTVSLTGSDLGALSNVPLPNQGTTNFTPTAIATGDINHDGLSDLVVTSNDLNNVNVFLGNSGGGFSALPDLILDLPAGAKPSAILLADLNNDAKLDIAVANSGPGNVTVYLNQNTAAGELNFDAGTNFAVAAGINSIVAGKFNADNKIDLALASSTASGSAYNVYIITGNDDGTFNAATAIKVGDTTTAPLNLASPSSLAVGQFNNDNQDDLVVGGGTTTAATSGVSILLNTSSGGTLSFATPTFVAAGAATSVATAVVRTNAGNNAKSDIVVTTTASSGQLYALLNDGKGNFQLTGGIGAGVSNPAALQLQNLNAGPGLELVYVNNAAAGGVVSRSRLQTGLIEAASSDGTNPISITSTGHGLQDGQQVVIAGVGGLTAANGTFFVTRVDADHFTLNGTAGTAAGTATANTGTWIALPGVISQITTSASGPITIKSYNHGLRSGQQITINNIGAATGSLAGVNGSTFFITRIDADTFSLNGTSGTGTYTANTGTFALPVYATGALPVGVALTPSVRTGAITNATGAGVPIVLTSNNHGLQNGQRVFIQGVGGNTSANGAFTIQNVTANTFELVGSTGSATYTSGGTWSTLPADFNGDNIADLVVANRTDNTLSYYRGSGSAGVGDGTFLSATNLPLAGTGGTPRDVQVGDFNGDGIPDLVAADTAKNQIHVFLGLPGGGYSKATSISTGSAGTVGNSRQPVSIAIGDVNGDKKLDIVVASQQDSNVAVFAGKGDGTFNRLNNAGTGTSPTQVVLADLNNDGNLDLVVSHNPSSTKGFSTRGVTVRLGNGNGTFQSSSELFSKNAPQASGVAVADFNRDGILDIAVTDDSGTGRVLVLTGTGAGKFASGTPYSVGTNPTAIVTGDFNADGFTDIATISRSDTTEQDVSVLLNNAGTGFQTAVHTSVPTGGILRSVQAVNINSDPFVDLVVTSSIVDVINNTTSKNGSDGIADPNTPNPANNVHVLFGVGDGSFSTRIDDYTVAGPSTASPPTSPMPTDVAVVSDPFRLLTTFNVGGTTVSVNLVKNGNFEARDLTNEQGNLSGWSTYKLDTGAGSAGQWLTQTGTTSPLSQDTVVAPSNRYQAMLDQQNARPFNGNNNPNSDESYAGTHALYQDVTIPVNATSVRLSMNLFLKSADAWSNPAVVPALNHNTSDPNQQVRVDIVSPTGAILGVGTNVLLNVFQTQTNTPTDTTNSPINIQNIDLSAFKGQTIRLRIAATNNQGKLIVGVDNVRVQTVFTDSTAPQIVSLNLRNPTFLASPNTLEQSTDPTIVGQFRDNGSVNNVKQVVFDLANNGFGNADDAIITNFDVNGFFSFTPSTLLPGVLTVPVRVIDQAGNVVQQNYQFILQSPSLTNWQSVGPGPIDISAAGLNYNTVSGKVTGIAVDSSDPSGNTFYIGSANGGVWKTTNGGKDWLALTDNVTDANGQRVNVSVGSLAIGDVKDANQVVIGRVLYAATGLDDNTFTSRTSVGVLRSTDDGRSWQVIGTSTANGSVDITGARVSKIVVDPTNSNVVYLAITSWKDATKGPMLLKTTNGLAANPTWVNVLDPVNMLTGRNGSGGALGAGTALASVTDIIVDPFDANRVIIGLGNIGQYAARNSAGVWKSIDGGATWLRQEGGDNVLVNNGTLPFGTSVGRVTVAQGVGRGADERYIYVLMSNPPGGTDQFQQGGLLGLYKSKDNMLNFTKVMLKQEIGSRGAENFADLELFDSEGGNVGALVVDSSNANVVYVGGSRRFTASGLTEHALIRVDTGNMRDTSYVDGSGAIPNDGDDISKAFAAATAQPFTNKYPGPDGDPSTNDGASYTGEGVYWYDIEMSSASNNSNRRRLPPSIQRLTFDTQGRLLIGTENGLFRGVPLGFGYDFSSGGDGIIRSGGRGGGTAFTTPGMTITELNGNLQITDLTSVAIDPTDRSRLYVSASGVGTALFNGTSWQTMTLTGPTVPGTGNLGIPNAFQVLTANPPAGETNPVTRLYQTWQYDGRSLTLTPELSEDAGANFTALNVGNSTRDTAGLSPVLAINPYKPGAGANVYDQLLFVTDTVYLTRTGLNVLDAIPQSTLTGGDTYSAVAFSPVDGTYLAGTNNGTVRLKTSATNFTDITGNLLTAGAGGAFRVNGITVDPRSPNVIYVMMATPSGRASVFRTSNANGTATMWEAVGGGLPMAPSYKMVIDPRASTGAMNGRMYVGTDLGVYTSVDSGTTWSPLGQGLPAAPVVDLQFNPTLEILAAATQGRGVFTLSTARSGPAIVDVTPAAPVNDGPLSEITITFNNPVDPRTFNADQNNVARSVMSLVALTSTDFAVNRIKELVRQYLNREASAAEIDYGVSLYLLRDPSTGAVLQQTDPALPGVVFNRTKDTGEFDFISFILSDSYYFAVQGGGTNATWIDRLWLDLFGRSSGVLTTGTTADDDPYAVAFLNQLNAGQITRLGITSQLTGARSLNGSLPGPSSLLNPLHPLSREFQTNLLAARYNQLLGRNYPKFGAVSTEIAGHVNGLQNGDILRNILARIISTTEAYQKMGNDYGLPAGTTATAVAFGNFTGAAVNLGGTGSTATVAPILDLVVAGSDNKVRIFQGKAGGGFAPTPSLVLNLPAGANPAALLVADLNGDGKQDLAVANAGLTAADGKSVSTFINNRAAAGQLSFALRTDLNGGNNPIGLAFGDIDGDTRGDLVVANRALSSGNNYTVNILLGNAGGGLNAPVEIKVGDANPNASELVAPTGIAIGLLNNDAKPDLVLSGDNGLLLLTNTSTAGSPSFTASARLTNTPTTSVAVGNLDTDSDLDIAASSDNAAGEVLLFRNDGGAFGSAGAFTVPAGSNPRSLKLGDMNGDGRLDLVAVNTATGGGTSILFNTTSASGTGQDMLSFAKPLTYPVTGARPSVLALGDTNQDGITDAALGYGSSEFVSLLVGEEQGLLKIAKDRNWLDWIFRTLAGRPFSKAERDQLVLVLAENALVFVNSSDGVAMPISVTPTDATNLTYKLTFGPRLRDVNYQLFVGPNGQGINLKDFTDLDGTYTNTGNAMNQDGDAINGERPGGFPFIAQPGDKFARQLSVNQNDNGRFLFAIFEDFQGLSPAGRLPDNPTFFSLNLQVERGRFASLSSTASQIAAGTEAVDALIRDAYQRYLRRAASAPEVTAVRSAIQNGQLSVRTLVGAILASDEYFNNATFGGAGNNTTWMRSIYRDVLAVIDPAAVPAFPAGQPRAAVANALVLSDAALARTATEYFLKFLGRTPNRSFDASLDETRSFLVTSFFGQTTDLVGLLRTGPAAGQPTGDQRVIAALVSSGEYLRLNGNSNLNWLKSVFIKVLGRPSVDTTSAEFKNTLNALLSNYTPERDISLGTIILTPEFRTRKYTDYYSQYLASLGRGPTAAEIASFEAIYTNNGTHLEAVLATILGSPTYFPLSGQGSRNDTYLTKLYGDLGISISQNQLAYNQQLNTLDNTTPAQLQAARTLVARQLLDSSVYHQILVNRIFTTYLNRAPSQAESDLYVGYLNQGVITEEGILIAVLRHPEYFLLQ